MKRKSNVSYINHHEKYIDTRISNLIYYVSSEMVSLPLIIDMLLENTSTKLNLPDGVSVIIDELRTLMERWDIFHHGDLIGYIYQELQLSVNKKAKGQFFTPDDIVAYITDSTITSGSSVLDPSCGSGQFIIAAFKRLMSLAGFDKDSADVTSDKYKIYAEYIIENKIYGFDIDPIAIKIASYNLRQVSGCSSAVPNLFLYDYLDKSFLKPEKVINKKFQFIIGNPPWGSRISSELKSYFKHEYYSAASGLNTFTFFIERSIYFLAENGALSFLVPEAYLNIKAHKNSRELVLSQFKINEITIWGDRFKNVYAPSISLKITKELNPDERQKHICSVRPQSSIKDGTALLVPQMYFSKTPENIFNINYSRKAVNVISSIENNDCLYLKDRAKFFLGIVTGNNEKYLGNLQDDSHPDPIIIGKDMDRYAVNFSDHYFKYNPVALQQVAPRNFYTHQNKIIYKFIGRKLTFALEEKGYYTLNNVNGFIPEMAELKIEALLSLLNSSLMQYYYEKTFFTVKVLRGNLERLPLKILKAENQQKIARLAQLIMKDRSGLKGCQENIDDIIFHEYGISDKNAYMVKEDNR